MFIFLFFYVVLVKVGFWLCLFIYLRLKFIFFYYAYILFIFPLASCLFIHHRSPSLTLPIFSIVSRFVVRMTDIQCSKTQIGKYKKEG